VYVPVVFTVWIVIPTYVILSACFTTDIIDNVCYPWEIYSGVAHQKAMASLVVVVDYILPLALMIFWYRRIVYKLRIKVTTHRHGHTY